MASTLTKVFVGNLSFKTKEAELAASFDGVGKVVSANIITRGPRSLGYGFVEFESEEDAKKAVSAMDKKDLDGRVINVEIAKERVEGEKPVREPTERSPRRRAGRHRGRGPRGPRPRQDKPKEEGADQAQDPQERPFRPKRRPRPRGPKPSEEGAAAAPAEKPVRVKRERRERVPDEQKEESKTTLFVANLPFSLDDDAFGKLFSDLGLKAKKAHVVKKRNGRSKGYGFVEFETQEDQKKGLEQKFTVQERELSLKIAYFVEATEGEKASAEGAKEEKKEEKKEDKKEVKQEEKKEEKKEEKQPVKKAEAEKKAPVKKEETEKKETPKKETPKKEEPKKKEETKK